MPSLAAWNLARGLSSYEKHTQIEQGLESLDADIMILGEAIDNTGKIRNQQYAQQLGYDSTTLPYNDLKAHPSGEQYLTLLSRVALDEVVPVYLGSRNAVKVTLVDPSGLETLDIYGAHFDDRSEAARLGMAYAFLSLIEPGARTVLAGDLNAMPANNKIARVLRSRPIRTAAALVPHARTKSLTTRLTDMATGDVMTLLETSGFQDADTRNQPTMKTAVLRVMLDHIMHTPNVTISNFENYDIAGSDHCAITAQID